MTQEKEDKALKILQSIGYDNDSITQTEMWIALELDNIAHLRTKELEDRVKELEETLRVTENQLNLYYKLYHKEKVVDTSLDQMD